MSKKQNEKITIELPVHVYHHLRSQAKRVGIDLPGFVRRHVELKPAKKMGLAQLPLHEIFSKTEPEEGEDRLNFFAEPGR